MIVTDQEDRVWKCAIREEDNMKAKIDENLCTGCGLCVDTCPEAFKMDDSLAKVIVVKVPENIWNTCREAADNCPVEAISIEE